jgi:hypothetical protein
METQLVHEAMEIPVSRKPDKEVWRYERVSLFIFITTPFQTKVKKVYFNGNFYTFCKHVVFYMSHITLLSTSVD